MARAVASDIMVTSSNVLTPAQNNSFGVHITKQGVSQQHFLKQQIMLKSRIAYARKLCEHAGKLGLPQATDKADRLC